MREASRSGGRWRRAVGLAMLLGATGACSDGPAGPGDEDPQDAELVMSASVAGTTIATIVVQVTGPGISTPLVFNLAIDESGFAFGTLKIPPGTDRLIVVQAFDDQGNITHEGEVTINVNPGQNPPVSIVLVPRAGHVPIDVSMGDLYIYVNPNLATTVVGQPLNLFAGILGPTGQVNGTLQWASDNPAIATVDQNGVVTPLLTGTVHIFASYAGYSGSAEVKILPAGFGLLRGWAFSNQSNLQWVDIQATGVDEFGQPIYYYAQTDETGYYEMILPIGSYAVDAFIWNYPNCEQPPQEQATVFEGQASYVYFFLNCTNGTPNNETDAAAEADYCIITPPSVTVAEPGPFAFYGELYEAGLTETAGDPGQVIAQFGYGFPGTDPVNDPTWNYVNATYNAQVINNDEWWTTNLFASAGPDVAYVFRVSLDGGVTWTYCDTDGAGSNAGLDFNPGLLATLQITP